MKRLLTKAATAALLCLLIQNPLKAQDAFVGTYASGPLEENARAFRTWKVELDMYNRGKLDPEAIAAIVQINKYEWAKAAEHLRHALANGATGEARIVFTLDLADMMMRMDRNLAAHLIAERALDDICALPDNQVSKHDIEFLRALANYMYFIGDQPSAQRALKEVLALRPHDEDAERVLLQCYLKENNLDLAKPLMRKYPLSATVRARDYSFDLGAGGTMVFFNLGEARPLTRPERLYRKAVRELRRGSYNSALRDFKECLQSSRHQLTGVQMFEPACAGMLAIYLHRKNNEKAVEVCSSILNSYSKPVLVAQTGR